MHQNRSITERTLI